MEIINPPSLQDLALCECITDYISPKDLFNYFTDTPEHLRLKDPYHEFVNLCRTNLGWGAKYIIGKGDFELLPFQCVILDILWNKTFPILLMTRGGGKSMMLAVYAIMRAVLDQNSHAGSRIVIVGASFRQSKIVMEYIEQFWKMSPLLQAACDNVEGMKKHNDKWEFCFGKSNIIALPLGDGRRIRGIRATHVLSDEFASIPQEIFDIVVRGFAAVSQNPVEKVRTLHTRKRLIKEGKNADELPDIPRGNQIVRSGTGNYQFNHFYAVYEQYMKIIKHKIVGFGSEKHVKEILGDDIPKDMYINYKDYAILQVPHTALPDGYMDSSIISEAALRMSKDEYAMEYDAKFISDSNGFFKASAIDAATPRPGDPLFFNILLDGNPSRKYVMGLDPARKSDKFALVILEVSDSGYRVVYVHQWDKKNFGEIAREIRRLCKIFNIMRIGIDQGGGGTAVLDFLQTPELIPQGELPFWEIDTEEKVAGKKILDMINYMGQWIKTANYDLAADIEHRRLIFPYCALSDTSKDTVRLEEIFDLVIEMKRQLTNIQITATDKTEIEHFDLPEELKWKEYKDLYSALLIAAYEARQLKGIEVRKIEMNSSSVGGSINEFV